MLELMRWIDSVTAAHKYISPEILADLDARVATRALLNHQFETLYGFSPQAPPVGPDPRVRQAIRAYMIASLDQIGYFLNYLCVQRSGIARDRVLYLQTSNRALFDLYAEMLHTLRGSGTTQSEELLAILDRPTLPSTYGRSAD